MGMYRAGWSLEKRQCAKAASSQTTGCLGLYGNQEVLPSSVQEVQCLKL